MAFVHVHVLSYAKTFSGRSSCIQIYEYKFMIWLRVFKLLNAQHVCATYMANLYSKYWIHYMQSSQIWPTRIQNLEYTICMRHIYGQPVFKLLNTQHAATYIVNLYSNYWILYTTCTRHIYGQLVLKLLNTQHACVTTCIQTIECATCMHAIRNLYSNYWIRTCKIFLNINPQLNRHPS